MDLTRYSEPVYSRVVMWTGLSRARRIAVTVGLLALYALAYPSLSVFYGGATIFVSIPTAIAAWLFGARIGIAAAILVFPLNSFMEVVVSDRGWVEWLQSGGIVGHGMLLLAAAAIGLMRDLATRNRAEISARVQAEELLRESEQRYRSLYEGTPVMMQSMDRQFRLTNVNQQWLETLGYRRDEVIGREFAELLEDSSARRVVEYVWPRILKGQVVKDAELQAVTKNGELADFVLCGATVVDGALGPSQVLAFLTNITERRQAETERRALEIAALTQSKLATLGEISAGVAHEINQPLTYIDTMIQTTREDFELKDVDEERVIHRLTESRKYVGRINEIIGHLRTFGRDDEDELTPVDLSVVLDNTLLLLGERLHQQGIDVTRLHEAGSVPVHGNANRLEQVFINLFQNSAAALSRKRSDRKIGVTVAELPDRGQVQIKFSDNGPGIAPGDMGKVFEPFFTTRKIGEGTGLGLAIVYGIVQAHHGDISCESKLRHGTTFTINLPAQEVPSA